MAPFTTTIATTTSPIRDATAADHDDMAGTLAAAFRTDPVFVWMIPDPERRRAALQPFFALITDAIGRHGVSLTTGDGGVALWVPPGEEVVDEVDAEAFGERIAEIAGAADIERTMTAMTLLEENHPHEPLWYLNFLGVAPYLQGRGVGSAMLRRSLARSDADGIPRTSRRRAR